MTAVIDGQLSIFDWMEDFAPAQDAEQAAGLPELKKITEEEAARIIGARIGVNFVYDPSFGEYKAKVGEITLNMNYDNYDESVHDGRRMISVGYSGKHFGGGSPTDSIDEAVECLKSYIESVQDRTDQVRGCGRRCKYEWGSKRCFESRGQIYDYHERKWLRDEEGRPVIGKRTCDWETGEGQ